MQTKELDFPLSIKSISADGSFAGYASIFDITDSHNDVVMRGAFERSLTEGKSIKLLWQHRMDEPIGVIEKLYEDERGLYIEGKLLLDVARAKESYSLLKSGAIDGLSIGYSVVEYDIDGKSGVRLLKDLDLWEVSLVTFPANSYAGVTHLKGNSLPSTIREFEIFLREAGFSRSNAKSIATIGFEGNRDDCDEYKYAEKALDRALLALEHFG